MKLGKLKGHRLPPPCFLAIEAIIYALYGPKQRKGVKDICTDNIVNGEVRVEIECIIDGQNVRIVRTDNKASLWINGALQVQDITNSQSQVNKQIGNLLGNLTREQFESTYVAMQGNTSGLVEMDNREVSRTIEKLLQLGELHEAIPDPLEERNLKVNQQALSQKIKQLKEQADLYAQLPHFQDQLTHKQQEYQQLHKTIEEHQKNLAAIGYDPDLFQQTQKNLQEAHRQAQQIQSNLDQALKLLHETQLNEQSLRRDGELAKQEYVRFQEAFTEYQHEERLLVLMDDFKKHFFAANTQEVAQRTAELLRDAVTDQSILGIQFDPKGLFYRDGSSIVRPVQRLSGGEKALVGLCLRLALAEQAQIISRIGKVKFLILDEVLASLDEERCEAVQRIFQNVLQRGIFEQIIMVTHLKSVKQSWQAHGLTIEKADSTTSKITTNASQHTYYEVLEEIGV